MRRALGSGMGAAALMFGLAAAADPAPDAAAATAKIQVSGTFKLNGNFTVTKALAAGTIVSASVYMSTSDGTYSDSSSIQAQGKVRAGRVRFTVTVPYTWLVAATTDKVTVTVNLSGSTPASSGNSLYYTSYLTRTVALPKNGATTAFNFTGSL